MPKTSTAQDDMLGQIANAAIHRHLGLTLVDRSTTTTTGDEHKHEATATLVTTSAHLTPTGTIHGGINALCLDVVCAMAAVSVLEQGELSATVTSAFQHMGNVTGEGNTVTYCGRVVKRTRTMLFCESEATSAGKLLSKATLTKMVISTAPRPKL